jgi:predicted transcriptional regulator
MATNVRMENFSVNQMANSGNYQEAIHFEEGETSYRWKTVLWNVLTIYQNKTFEEVISIIYSICEVGKGIGMMTVYEIITETCKYYKINIENLYIIFNGLLCTMVSPFIVICILVTYIIYITNTISKLNSEIRTIKKQVVQCETSNADITNLYNAISKLNSEIHTIKTQVVQCETGYTDITDTITREIKMVDDKITNINNTITEVSHEIEMVDDRITNINNTITHEIEMVDDRITNIHNTITEVKSENQTIERIDTKFTQLIHSFTQTEFMKVSNINQMQFINTYKTRGIYFTNDFNVDNCVKLFSGGSFPSVNVLYIPSPYMVSNENRNDFIKLFPNVNHIYIRASSMSVYYLGGQYHHPDNDTQNNRKIRQNDTNHNIKIYELICYFASCGIPRYTVDNMCEPHTNSGLDILIGGGDRSKYPTNLEECITYKNLIKYTQFIELEDHSYDKYINSGYLDNHLTKRTNFR